MATSQEMNFWLEKSEELLQQLLPENVGPEIYGQDLSPVEFAQLIDREFLNIDQLLIEMGTAENFEQAKAICNGLSDETAIGLFSRWGQYKLHWKHHPNPGHWTPKESDEIWRAILVCMKFDKSWSIDSARPILAEWFPELTKD